MITNLIYPLKKTIHIEGMSCHHCVHAVRRALTSLDGIEVESVEIGSATFDVAGNDVDLERVREAVEEEGYTVVDG